MFDILSLDILIVYSYEKKSVLGITENLGFLSEEKPSISHFHLYLRRKPEGFVVLGPATLGKVG